MSAHSTTPAPLIAIVALVAACTAGNEAPHPNAAAAPTVVILTAIDYAFEAPDTIPAGFTTFRMVNNSEQFHMAQLIKLEGGRTLDDFLQAYSEAFRTVGPRPEWAKRLGGPGVADPHGESNATQYLEAGSYAWICLVNPPPDQAARSLWFSPLRSGRLELTERTWVPALLRRASSDPEPLVEVRELTAAQLRTWRRKPDQPVWIRKSERPV
ncbi:MAG: hypothetical protein ACREOC_02505 [Gemmatimonadales bacterium]